MSQHRQFSNMPRPPSTPTRGAADTVTNIQHGHNGSQIVVLFSQSLNNLALTVEQAQAFMAAMQNSIEKLAEHQKGKTQ